MMKASIIFSFVLLGGLLRGNPVPTRMWVMTGENVLVSVSPETISVAGNYRFHVIPGMLPPGVSSYFASVRLPIPIPNGQRIDEGLMHLLKPELTLQGVTIEPEASYSKFSDLPSVDGVKFMVASFFLEKVSVPEFEVTIKYTQPVIHRDGKLLAYYVPLLPGYDEFETRLALRPSSYAVSFESFRGSTLSLSNKFAKVLQSNPRLISVEAHHHEVIEVEILSGSASEPAPQERRSAP